MEVTLTAKIKIQPNETESNQLYQTVRAYQAACNYVSALVFKTGQLSQGRLHEATYRNLRGKFNLKSQMAQSVLKTVIARYKSARSNGHEWSLVEFKQGEYDLVFNRDYSVFPDKMSVNTLDGRIKVPFFTKGIEEYFNNDWSFGTAKLVYKHKKWFLHIPMTKEIDECEHQNIQNIVGIDLGINFIATSYDSKGKTQFFSGKQIKHKRATYKQIRKDLQHRQTPSARKRLRKIGQRENRWMHDVNHKLTKALVNQYGQNTLFVLEDLTGIRNATEKVKIEDRYTSVSWAFYDFRSKLEYKALKYGAKVIAFDPAYTSQTCPKCGYVEASNRIKKEHRFKCKTCSYESNDDRIAAMNLHRKGIEYQIAVLTA